MSAKPYPRRPRRPEKALAILGAGALWLLPAVLAAPPKGQYAESPEATAWRGQLESPGQPDQREESVLLLRNGQLIQGRITRTEDRYTVIVPGGEIIVRTSEVDQHCRNIAEAYHLKRAAARLDSARDHIELAQWCHKHGLPELAEEELAQARAIDPAHPMLALVDRQLRLAASAKGSAAAPGKPHVVGPSVQDLDRMVRAMPPKSVETFAQVIQPMLVNHCGSVTCHAAGAQNRFRLLRPPAGSLPSRRLTQRNLHSVLEWVNRDSPEKSPLLTVPSGPHGPARAPVFTNNQTALYQQLTDWCYRVSRTQGPAVRASYEQPVGGGRNEPGSANAARAALRAERTQEREGAKAALRQRGAEMLYPFSAGQAGELRLPDRSGPQPGPPERPGYSPADRASRPSPPGYTSKPIPPPPD